MTVLLIPVALVVFVCLPLALTATAVLSRTRFGAFLGVPVFAQLSRFGVSSWLRALVSPVKLSFTEDDWVLFDRLLQSQSVGRGAREPLGPAYMPPPSAPSRFFTPDGRVAKGVWARRVSALSFLTVGAVLASFVVFSALSSASDNMPSVLASSLTGATPVAVSPRVSEATVYSSRMPDILAHAAASGFALTCGGVLVASPQSAGPLPSAVALPTNVDGAEFDWASCSGELSGYGLSFRTSGANTTVIVAAENAGL